MPRGYARALADDDRAIEVRPSDNDYISSKRAGTRRLTGSAEGCLVRGIEPGTAFRRLSHSQRRTVSPTGPSSISRHPWSCHPKCSAERPQPTEPDDLHGTLGHGNQIDLSAESAICANCNQSATGCWLHSVLVTPAPIVKDRRATEPTSASGRKRRSLSRHRCQDLSYSGGRLRGGIALSPFPPQGCTSVVWLPVWLPNGRKGAGIRTLSCAPSRTRTYGLLLRRHFP